MAGPPPGVLRILVIDSHIAAGNRLRIVLEHEPDLRVLAEVRSVAQALTAMQTHTPDIVVFDATRDEAQVLEAITGLTRATQGAKILVLTHAEELAVHRSLLAAGALGVVINDTALETLARAVRRVSMGEVWLDQTVIVQLLRELVQPRQHPQLNLHPGLAALTAREREVVVQVSNGLKNRQIAERLSISEATVRHHLTSIFTKLNVEDRLSLVVFAFRSGIVSSHQ